MSKSLQGASVSMRELAKALEEYNKEVNRQAVKEHSEEHSL
jgi:hypothetical protein